MKRLLRGIMDWGSGISQEGLVANYNKLRSAKFTWLQSTDRKIYKYVTDFYEVEQVIPSSRILVDFFTKIDDIETLERLKDIGAATPYEGANYSHILRTIVEDGRRARLTALLKDAKDIAEKGLMIGEGREKKKLEGVDDAMHRLRNELHKLELESQDGVTEANLPSPEDIQEGLVEYERAKLTTPMGVLTGLPPLDAVTRGLRLKQLWTHAAYTGGLKSTWAINWAVRAVINPIRPVNVLFYSLEMSIEELRPAVFALYAGATGRDLSVTDICTGKLDEENEEYFRMSLRDLNAGEYGHILLRCPARDTSISDIASEIRRLSGDYDIEMVVIDHSGLLATDRHEKDTVERYSSTFRDAKKLSREAYGGKGVGVLMLHQINREGGKRAAQGGQFTLNDMGMTIESARSSDVVTTSWQDDELRNAGQARFQLLKNRGQRLIEPFVVEVNSLSRRISYGERSNAAADEDEIQRILGNV